MKYGLNLKVVNFIKVFGLIDFMKKKTITEEPATFEEGVFQLELMVISEMMLAEKLFKDPELNYSGRETVYQSLEKENEEYANLSHKVMFADTPKARKALIKPLKKKAQSIINQIYDAKIQMQKRIQEIAIGLAQELEKHEYSFWERIVDNGLTHREEFLEAIPKIRQRMQNFGGTYKDTQDKAELENVVALFSTMMTTTTKEELQPILSQHGEVVSRILAYTQKYKNSGLNLSPFTMLLAYADSIFDTSGGSGGKMLVASNLVGELYKL